MVFINCRFIVIGISRNIVFQVKKLISVPVNVVFRRCRKTYKQCVKIFKYSTIFLKILLWLSSIIIKSKCAGVNKILSSSFFSLLMALSIVGYVEKTILAFCPLCFRKDCTMSYPEDIP